MPQKAVADLSAPAHSSATVALDDFEALATEYSALLDTQRALLAAGNVAGVAETVARGDAVARQVAACGRRLAPWREALGSQEYSGPRASDLVRRFGESASRADRLAAAAARIEALCVEKRDRSADEMRGIHPSTSAPALVAARYYAPAVSASSLDTRG